LGDNSRGGRTPKKTMDYNKRNRSLGEGIQKRGSIQRNTLISIHTEAKKGGGL